MESKGYVYIFTGDGKGKTSAALGVGLRACLSGLKVAMVQWYKDPAWNISEHQIPKYLKNFSIYPMGQGFYLKHKKTAPLSTGQVVIDKAKPENHHQAAATALSLAQKLITEVDVLILDEINNAVSDGLVNLTDLTNLIKGRQSTHLILTGRNASPAIIEIADLVTHMDKVKHPYDLGLPAVKGLDF